MLKMIVHIDFAIDLLRLQLFPFSAITSSMVVPVEEAIVALATFSLELAINKFANRTKDEFKGYIIGHKDPYDLRSPLSTSFKYESVNEVPPSMDWREKGAVSEVKNQGVCV
ncbi:hypothetical protein L1987_56757 [Smallanthus sonchifolius]|uniref:Uncharacterized protein n=1 Tax=Smallanthus sonchifolius TaxID=185202 RepID=A0ACB9DAM3_9ASTR|nr:hypothetical protein L1987_56757 [Smallanthus sonchifolius]